MKNTFILLICSLSLAGLTLAEPPAKGAGKGDGKGAGKGAGKGGMPEFLKKYDTNKDGRLDEGERAKVSDEDKEKIRKAREGKGGPDGKGGKGAS